MLIGKPKNISLEFSQYYLFCVSEAEKRALDDEEQDNEDSSPTKKTKTTEATEEEPESTDQNEEAEEDS